MNSVTVGPSRYEKFLIKFCIIDILFLTYIPFIALTFSVPFSLLWVIWNTKSQNLAQDREWRMFLVFCGFVFIACLFSLILVTAGAEQSIKASIELILICHVYFIFKYFAKYVRIDKYLCWFIYLGSLLAIIYLFDRSFFIDFKHIVNPYDGDSLSYYSGSNPISQFRYNFLWTDANNVAYIFSATLYLLYAISDYSLAKKTILFLCVCLSVLVTMSLGGMLSLVSVFVLSMFTQKKKRKGGVKIHELVSLLILLILILVCIPYIKLFLTTNITVLQSMDRVQNNTSGAETRIQIWIKFLANKPIYYYILFGEGPIHIISGNVSQPHNGFLYLIYGFGFIGAFIFFILFLIPKEKLWRCPYYLPIYLGLFINTLITNPKILGILFLIKICSDKDFIYIGDTRRSTNSKIEKRKKICT